jgi:hypothetical protein
LKRGSSSSSENRSGRKKHRRKNNLLKVFLFLIAASMVPVTASLLLNFPLLFHHYSALNVTMIWSIVGFVVFILLFFTFGAPVKSYILEHELSHLLIAVLSGIRVRSVSFKVTDAYVRTDRINPFIALVPYSLPLYSLVIILLFKMTVLITQSSAVRGVFYILIGMSLSFHFVATIHYLHLDQPDLRRYGYFSSLILIVTWATVIIALILAMMFERVSVFHYFRVSLGDAGSMYRAVIEFLTNGTFFS